ncbi:MAG: PAS domain-containing protein, partial [Nitrospirae bacterium]
MSAHHPHQALRQVALTLAHTAYEALPLGLCLVDDRGCIVSLNTEGARMLGWTEADCLGFSLHELTGCGSNPANGRAFVHSTTETQARDLMTGQTARCPVAQVFDTGLPVWSAQSAIRARDGRWIPVEYKCLPLFDRDATGALFTFRDRSPQLQLEQDLHRLASIPEESPFPVVELDEEGHLLYANRAMLQLLHRFGYTDQGCPAILPDNLATLVRECLTAQACIEPVEVMLEDQCYAWTLCSVPVCRRLRAYGTNLTEIRRTERAIRNLAAIVVNKNVELDMALAKAEEAAQIKARFLATMSHEIRTPLNGVIGMLELLQDSRLNAEQADFAGTAR